MSGQPTGSSTKLEEVDIDFRVSGLPHAVAKQAENSRVRVKSIPPNTENSMQDGYDENDNNNMSNEIKRETNYSINNTRYMQLTKHNKYTNDDVHTNACVVHIMRWAHT